MKPKFRLHVGRTLFKNVYGLISHISTLKVMNTGRLITLAAFFGLLSAASIPASFQKLMREDMAAQLDEVGLVKAPSLRFEGEAGATEQVVNAGKPVELRCEAYGNPLPVVYWSRNGKPVLSEKPESNWFEKFTNMGSRTYQEGSTVALMRIPCASDLHAAMYTCVAENGHKRIERNVKLIVGDGPTCPDDAAVPPYIAMWSDMRLERELANVQVFCRTVGHPKPEVKWFNADDVEIEDGANYKVLSNGDLLVKDTQFFVNGGTLKCSARNKHGEHTMESFVYATKYDGEDKKL